ncbi:hypothetical protein E2C01_031893 [Portunus trituberculatus]|uniref:Uncharacterized protein n=1 Tax=Portunus trituberculatus TaxID=210409 RepID=A0A5B7EYW1_PORTR|nr:hypothetical protein [Portunus trituberculatus]
MKSKWKAVESGVPVGIYKMGDGVELEKVKKEKDLEVMMEENNELKTPRPGTTHQANSLIHLFAVMGLTHLQLSICTSLLFFLFSSG